MAKLSDWGANALTKRIDTDLSILPCFYVSKIGPNASELTAVSNKELADGWPTEMVQLNTVRRQAKYPFYVGPNGLSLGAKPAYDIAPSLNTALSLLKPPKGLRYLNRGDMYVDRANMQAMYETHFLGAPACISYAQRLVGQELEHLSNLRLGVGGGFSTAASLAAMIAQTAAACEADVNDEFLHVGYQVHFGWYDAWGQGDWNGPSVSFVGRFRRPAGMKGLRGMVYTPLHYGSGIANNTYADRQGWGMSRIFGDRGIDKYLRQKYPALTIRMAEGTEVVVDNYKNLDSAWNEVVLHQFGANPTAPATWWGSSRTLFEEKNDVWYEEVYAIGNPEFANRTSVVGVWNDTRISGAKLSLDWDGDRLAAVSPQLAVVDKERLSKLFVSSVVYPQPLAFDGKLDDLYVEQLYKQNELSVADEVFLSSKVVDGESIPEATFAEVLAEANLNKPQVWHRMTSSEFASFEVDRVAISGSDVAVSVTSYVGLTVASTDVQYGMMCYLHGSFLDTSGWTGGIVQDPIMAAWGISSSDFASQKDKIAMKKQFDEGTIYGPGAPFLENLGPGDRTAMSMVQVGVNRKSFSSFVVGSCMMAANARKILL